MFTPGIAQIAADLDTSGEIVVGATTSFVVFLGIGPLILAPLSETFGRRKLYLICFSVFAILQIPTALSPNVEFLITLRAFSGFFGSQSSVLRRHPDVDLLTKVQAWALLMVVVLSATCSIQARERKSTFFLGDDVPA